MQNESSQLPPPPGTTTGQPDGADAQAEPGELQQMLSVGLIGLGSVMMVIVITRMLRRTTRNRNSRSHTTFTSKSPQFRDDDAATPDRHGRPGSSRAVADASAAKVRLDRVMADGEELTRRLAAILDNKAARIEVLLEHADQRLAALAEAEARAEHIPPPSQASRRDEPDSHREPPAPLSIDPLHRRVYELADKGATPVEIARQIDRPTGQIELILALRRA